MSSTFRELIKWKLWKTKPSCLLRKAANSLSLMPTVFTPLISTVPEVGKSSRPMIFNKVDFPHPEGPIMLRNSPCCTSRFTFSNATVSISFVR